MDTALLMLAIVLSCIALSVAIYLWLTKHSPSPRRVVTKEIPEDMLVTVGPETRESLVINGVVTYRKVSDCLWLRVQAWAYHSPCSMATIGFQSSLRE